MSHAAAFPRINGKPHAHLKEDLPGQIYTIDGFLSPQEVVNIRKWGESIGLQDPVPPRKGEAERTARELLSSALSINRADEKEGVHWTRLKWLPPF